MKVSYADRQACRTSKGELVNLNSHACIASAALPLTGIDHFLSPVPPLFLEVVTVEDPRNKDEKLSQAVNKLIPAALELRQGILVIQHDYGKYTVRVDWEVPCGMIHESPR